MVKPGCLEAITRYFAPRKTLNRRERNAKNCTSCIVAPHAEKTEYLANGTYYHQRDLPGGDEGGCSIKRSKTSGKLFVIKTIQLGSSKFPITQPTGRRKPLPNEAQILQKLCPHLNTIRFFACEQDASSIGRHMLFLEVCNGGDLLDQLRRFQCHKIPAPEVFTLHVFIGLAQALAYLHHGLRHVKDTIYISERNHEPIIHGDIKPENVFLRWPSRSKALTDSTGVSTPSLPDIVLADFGMAQPAHSSRGITGTPGYDSPEVQAITRLRDSHPRIYERKRSAPHIMTTKSDVYGLGLVIHLVATMKHFECGADPCTVELPDRYQAVTGLLAAVCWCLQPEPRFRPECTGDVEEGLLIAVDTFIRKRDAMLEEGGSVEGDVWNVSMLK